LEGIVPGVVVVISVHGMGILIGEDFIPPENNNKDIEIPFPFPPVLGIDKEQGLFAGDAVQWAT